MSGNHNDHTFAPTTPPLTQSTTDLGLLAMALIWGANFPIIKASLAFFPPLLFNALRFPLAAFTVFLVVLARGRIPWPEKADLPRIVALGILGNVVYQGFFILGIDVTHAGNASILLATTPVWIVILSTARGHERPGASVWLGILGTLVGMVLVVAGGDLSLELGGATLKGDLLVICAAVAWSGYSVGARKMIHKYGSLPVTAWTLWIGSAGLVALGLPSLLSAPVHRAPMMAWAGVAYAGILAIGLAYLLWNRGVQRIGNARTAVYSNLTPVVALAVAWIWLEETPGPVQLLGAGVILGGLSLTRTWGRNPDSGRGGDEP